MFLMGISVATAKDKVVVIPLMEDAPPPESITAAASSGTISDGIDVGTTYTTLVSKDVSIPAAGRIIIMGEASWRNSDSSFLGCRFLEDSEELDSWRWEAGDNDGLIDQHQSRFYLETVSPGVKTYSLECYRDGGRLATAFDSNLIVQFIREDM